MAHPIKPGLIDYARSKSSLILTALLGIQSMGLLCSTAEGCRRCQLNTLPPSSIRYSRMTQEPIPALEPGNPIVRTLSGGDAHQYQITIAAGHYARVKIDQRRINVAVSAFDAEGKKITDADMFPIGNSEIISFLAEAPVTYRLEVRASDKGAPAGSYEIKIQDFRPATDEDKSAVAAERLIAEGIRISSEGTVDACRKAIDKYQASIPLWRAAKDPAWEATALYLIGYLYIYLGDQRNALDFCTRALPVAEEAAKQAGEEKRVFGIQVQTAALDTIGAVHSEFGDKKKALELYDRALALAQSIGDRVGEGDTLYGMGKAFYLMGDAQKAFEVTSRARQLAAGLGDRRKESGILVNMCVFSSDMGEYRKAIDQCNESISIERSLSGRPAEATPLNNIGNAYSNLGEYQKALDFYSQALAIYKARDDRRGQAILFSNIAGVYGALGDYDHALAVYNQALEIARSQHDQYREANVLSNIAVNYAHLDDFQKSLDLHLQVLAVRRSLNDGAGEANTLTNIANCYEHLGDKVKAAANYDSALTRLGKAGNRSHLITLLNNVGAFYKASGQIDRAMGYFNEGLELARTIADRSAQALILTHIAQIERDRGDLLSAKSRVDQALAAVESVRIDIKSHQLRASFFAYVRKYYELDVDILMRLHKQQPAAGFDAAALQASETERARSLLELLAEASAEIHQGVDPALVERERALHQMISDKADRQMKLLSTAHQDAQAAAAASEIDSLTAEYDQVQARIRETSPRYAALIQPVPVSLKQIQTEVLDQNTLLLEYALGEEKSFLWAVTPGSISSFELPGRARIESAARRVYEMLTARNQTPATEGPDQKRKRLQQIDAGYPEAAAELSRILLGPVASELKNKRLLIAGEGVLQYLPFAALPELQTNQPEDATRDSKRSDVNDTLSSDSAQPLIVGHEIVCVPSASVLSVLRREARSRPTADKTLAVFADPVFDASDPRIAQQTNLTAAPATDQVPAEDIRRSAGESGLQGFLRLRFSRQEADQVARFAGEAKKLKALDFAASRSLATSGELSRYAIVHFATHGLINNEHPELSGIVLSLVDQQGQPQNGFLRLYDIYNLKLQADLVVLSACQTALGKQIKGEGLIGLTRGFMYAGAPRVIASLWQVDDRASADLMGRFYEAMLSRGLSPAAALRAAQISAWRDKRWRAPYYWAAFTLQGEWK
jgi:CHAT domain-containing protein/Tfp pilus assembly protein PilF